ncbi:MAG: T9SS type A sorting domain-containing protein [Saprospiraceae bacterium]|nr:T9SS type A sorting domain-containing protein [Saprospiraceae bacterium]
MQKLILILTWMAFLFPAHSQTNFSKIISNYPLDPETTWAVAEASDGYVIVSWGECLGQDVIICAVVSKLDKNGNVLWFKQFDFYPNPSNSLVIWEDKIYICGGTNQGEIQAVLYCLDMNGDLLWDRAFGIPDKFDAGASLMFTSDDKIVICGTRYPDAPGLPLRIVFLIKTDLDGNLIDEYTYDFQNRQSLGWSIIQATDGQIVFSYYACPVSCLTDFNGGVASVNTGGNLNWNLAFPLSFQPDQPVIIQSDSNTMVANWHTKTLLPNHDWTPPTLFYLDMAGQIKDSLVFENQSLKKINNIDPIWEKGVVGCGSNYIDYISDPDPAPGGWVFRVDENRTILWDRTFTDTSNLGMAEGLYSITCTSDGGYIAVGRLVNNMTGVFEAHNWILKLDSLGCLEPICGEVNYITDTGEITFLKGKDIIVYPNPASDYVNIRLPKDYSLNNLTAFLVSNDGKQIKKVIVSAIETQIIIPEMLSGIFYLILANKNEIVTSKRIVVNR